MAIEGWAAVGISLLGLAGFVLGVARQDSKLSGIARAAQVAMLAIGAIWVLVGIVAPSLVLAAWGAIHLGTAGGIAFGSRKARALEAVLGVITVLGVGFVALFSLALSLSEGGDLGQPMLGTGVIGVLNGWASLLLYALFISGGALMVVGGLRRSAGVAPLMDDQRDPAARMQESGNDSDG